MNSPKPKAPSDETSASELIDARIHELGDWRGETLGRIREIIREALPDVIEEVKWRGVPCWSHGGILCTGEIYKKAVKLTFAKGADVPDPDGLFNASLEGNTRRAIDIHEGETIDARSFKALILAAAERNRKPRAAKAAKPKTAAASTEVKLLSGGNPQIPKGDGDAPVQAYVSAMPGWKRGLGERLDALITREVRGLTKAVRWNSPFYGTEGKGWFLSIHCLTKYVKVTFFDGTSLDPVPPGGTPKSKDARWIDIHEGEYDEEQMKAWVKQASRLPGWKM